MAEINRIEVQKLIDEMYPFYEAAMPAITEIAMDAGFESQRTFNRVFREEERMTPREYRKRRFD